MAHQTDNHGGHTTGFQKTAHPHLPCDQGRGGGRYQKQQTADGGQKCGGQEQGGGDQPRRKPAPEDEPGDPPDQRTVNGSRAIMRARLMALDSMR